MSGLVEMSGIFPFWESREETMRKADRRSLSTQGKKHFFMWIFYKEKSLIGKKGVNYVKFIYIVGITLK